MKVKIFLSLVLLLSMAISCKQEVQPTLIVTVVDSLGVKLSNARVYTHPCTDGNCDTSRINIAFIKEALTNAAGEVSFEYPYSAIIDVQGQWTNCDTPDVYCMSVGKTVARFETKKLKKDEKNEYNVKLILYDEL